MLHDCRLHERSMCSARVKAGRLYTPLPAGSIQADIGEEGASERVRLLQDLLDIEQIAFNRELNQSRCSR